MTKKNKKQIIVALGLPINKQGEYLLTRRNQPRNKGAHNRWQITGGTVEFEEEIIDTLKREMMEEIGTKVKVLYPYPIIKTSIWRHPTVTLHALLVCYLVDIGTQQPVLSEREIAEAKWFSKQEIVELDYLPKVDEFIKEANELIEANNLLSKLG